MPRRLPVADRLTCRKLVSPPPANPWTHAAGIAPPPNDRPVDAAAVRESWRQTQVDIEDCNAVEAAERELAARRAREEEARAAAEASERRRRAAEARSTRGCGIGDDDVIDLCDSDDDIERPTEGSAARDTASDKDCDGAGKENTCSGQPTHRARDPLEEVRRAAAAKFARASKARTRAPVKNTTTTTHDDGPSSRGGGGGFSGNPFLDPPRYMPPSPRSGGVSAADLRLSTDEIAEVRDVGMEWYPCQACLDTGNGGCTLVVKELAIRMGLVDGFGNPKGGRTRMVHVQGVVAGASERIPTVTLVYRLKGKEMVVEAGVTSAAMGCDLLVSRRDIARFEEDGYTLTAR